MSEMNVNLIKPSKGKHTFFAGLALTLLSGGCFNGRKITQGS
jgi:hypothetical protein